MNSIFKTLLMIAFFMSKEAYSQQIPCPLHYHDSTQNCKIGNMYGQLQTFVGSSFLSIYLHPGIDFLGRPGQKVYSVRNGIVKAIVNFSTSKEDPVMWRIAISSKIDTSDTRGFLYAHLKKESFLVKVGDTVKAGQAIGELYKWPNEEYTHVHFSQIDNNNSKEWTGKWTAIREFELKKHGIADTTKPIFEHVLPSQPFAFIDTLGNYLDRNRLMGKAKIIFKCYDYCLSPYKTTVDSILSAFIPLGFLKKRGESLSVSNCFNMPLDVYTVNEKSPQLAKTIFSLQETFHSVCNHGKERHFFYYLINKNEKDWLNFSSKDVVWDFSTMAKGKYVLKITVKDCFGNSAIQKMKIRVI